MTRHCLAAGASHMPGFARRYSGFLQAVTPGKYAFTLTSDDAAVLWLNTELQTLNDYGDTDSGHSCSEQQMQGVPGCLQACWGFAQLGSHFLPACSPMHSAG